MSSPHVSIVGTGLSFAWPDGTVVFDRLDLAIGPGTTGLIGANGSGKSTLLRLIAGELRPRSGTVRTDGDVGYLPQNLTLDVHATVSDLLGVTVTRQALHAIEAGSITEADYAAVGDDWDIEERITAELAKLGLGHLDLDAPAGQLSGGEVVLVHLAALLLARPGVLLLDEPTNNLDRDARHRLYGAIEAWPGVILVVSHDRELLARVDQIADLASREPMDAQRSADFRRQLPAPTRRFWPPSATVAARAVRTATADVRQQRRDLNDTQTKLAGRERMGRKQQASGGQPRIVMGAKKRSAQVSAGKLRDIQEDRLAKAQDRLNEAKETARPDAEIRVALPGTVVPAGRTVLTARGLAGTAWRPGDRPAPAQPVTHMEGGVAGVPDPDSRPAPRRAHRPGPGADRADRAQRRGQDHPAARVRGPDRAARGRRPDRGRDRGRRRLPAAAAGRAGRLAQRAGQRAAAGPGGLGQPGPVRPGPVPVPR